MYILFQKYPNWENRANVRPVRPATWKKPTLSSTLCTITKLIHVLILLLTEIPQPGKQGKRSPRLPATQKPQILFSLQLGWTITKLYTYQFTSRLTQPKPYS